MVTNPPSFAPLFSILQPLLLPTALAGVLFGFALVAVEWRRKREDSQRTPDRIDGHAEAVGPSSTLKRVPVFLGAAVAIVGLIALVISEIRRAPLFHPAVLVAVGLLLVLAAPVAFWRSRWQRTSVGAATIAVSVLAFITGFSIGVLFVPLVIAMVLVCFSYLRRAQLSIR